MYVWSFTHHTSHSSPLDCRTSSMQSFHDRPDVTSCLGPPVLPPTSSTSFGRATTTATGRAICQNYNLGRCARGDECYYAYVSWTQGCQAPHPAGRYPKRATGASPTPLRPSQFEREFRHHPDKATRLKR